MDLDLLLENSRRLGFPVHLLRVALSSYRFPRLLKYRSWVAQPVLPSRGVLAGDVFAMALVTAYLWKDINAVAALHNEVTFRFYVDDAQMQAIGPPGTVVPLLHNAACDLFHALESTLRLTINKGKTAAVGSSKPPVLSLCRLLGINVAAAHTSIRNLGADFQLLRPRAARGAARVRADRFRKVWKISARVQILAKAAGRARAHRLFGTGLVPALGYAAEVTGFSDADLTKTQALALRTVTPGNRGSSRVARLALQGGAGLDRLACAALSRFAAEVWAALHGRPVSHTIRDLSTAWQVLTEYRGTWGRAMGPLHIAALEIKRVGWSPDPHQLFGLIDAQGVRSTWATRLLPRSGGFLSR